jgi:hypothetical protein
VGEEFVEHGAMGGEADGGERHFLEVQDEDAIQVGAEGLQARADGVLHIVLGVEDDGVASFEGRAIFGEGAAGAEAGAQVEGEEGLGQAGVALQEGQLAQGEAAGDEPVEGARGQLTGGAQAHGRGVGG